MNKATMLFKRNELSAAMLTHFRMTMLTIPEVKNLFEDVIVADMAPNRHEDYQTEKDFIMNLSNAEDIVSYMRKVRDQANSGLLIERAIGCQDDVMPLIFKRLSTSGHDVFIENAAILLANAQEKYTDQLYHIFPQIRNAYARSELCIVFGVKQKVEYTDFLLEQSNQLKAESTDINYEQGPLLALNLIYGE